MSIIYKGVTITSTPSTIKKAAVQPELVQVFDGLSKNVIKERTASDDSTSNVKCGNFITNADKCQESRRNHYHGMVNKMDQIKTCTGDDVMVVLWNADRQSFYVLSTDLEKLKFNPSVPSTTSTSTPTPTTPLTVPMTHSSSADRVDMQQLDSLNSSLTSAIMTSPLNDPLLPMPGLADISGLSELLSAASPTKAFPKQMTARKFGHQKRNQCRICGIEGNSMEDIDTDSPWIGCIYAEGRTSKHDGCSYWVHVHCKGFADCFSDKTFGKINYYCPEHNARAHIKKNKKRRRGLKTLGGKH